MKEWMAEVQAASGASDAELREGLAEIAPQMRSMLEHFGAEMRDEMRALFDAHAKRAEELKLMRDEAAKDFWREHFRGAQEVPPQDRSEEQAKEQAQQGQQVARLEPHAAAAGTAAAFMAMAPLVRRGVCVGRVPHG